MSGFKKVLILFLALLLPVVVFVFLKSFGKNEFVVTPLFQDSVSVSINCPTVEIKAPYFLPDSILKRFHAEDDSLTLIVLQDVQPHTTLETSIERISRESTVKVFYSSWEDLNLEDTLKGPDPIVTQEYKYLHDCVFLMKEQDNAVLVDDKRRIMGQYNLLDLEDADRLITEVKIISKDY